MRQGTIIISLNDTLKKEVHFYQQASTVGISPEQGKKELEIYPNPARSKIYLRIASTGFSTLTIDIFNISGEKVMNKTIPFSGTQAEPDISQLGKGIYFIKLTSSQNNFVKKLIIE